MQNWIKSLPNVFVLATFFASSVFLTAQSTTPQTPPRYDLLLKGGHVIDPANHIDEVRDVAVSQGKIAAVEKNIPADQAGKVVDVSNLYVTPGLVDIHYHIGHGGAPLNWFSPDARVHLLPLGIPADLALESGVTTVVDAGTSGAETFLQEKEEVIDRSVVRVLAFLNIVGNGMDGGLEQSLDEMDPKACATTIARYRDFIVGVKTAHYWTSLPWDAEHVPWAAVDRAIECATLANVPVMYDFWPRPDRTYEDLILKKMRPGDIHTHVFAQQFPIILPDGKLNPALAEARARGVIFDVGHGAGSFWFRAAVPAVKQGFIPDSMSTDLHIGDYRVVSMTNVMSKFLNMGVPLEDIIRRSTINPASEIRRPDLGTLTVGKDADIAVLELAKGHFSYIDCGVARMDGNLKLTARMTIRAGRISYDPTGLSMVEWEKARPQYFNVLDKGEGLPARADDFPRD
ncbi:MAG TPA: amidohydrolase/deacetylase family metallohydrolase [Candidatus Sulfotelmatobacter sp.]|nr:amidohydrolase/deacetylase family metallohydrolase [Candidatus Sulfotelmatobacter sp.]